MAFFYVHLHLTGTRQADNRQNMLLKKPTTKISCWKKAFFTFIINNMKRNHSFC